MRPLEDCYEHIILAGLVKKDRSSSPQGVSGDPSEKLQDGFPIHNVGNAQGKRSLFGRTGHNMEAIAHEAIRQNLDIVTIAIVFSQLK
jgi:hypothetical protein